MGTRRTTTATDATVGTTTFVQTIQHRFQATTGTVGPKPGHNNSQTGAHSFNSQHTEDPLLQLLLKPLKLIWLKTQLSLLKLTLLRR
ncbi:hypothetical protein Bca4012_046005 [Brassica carinata]